MGVIKRVHRRAIDASICSDTESEIVILNRQDRGDDDDSASVASVNSVPNIGHYYRRRTLRTRLPAIPSDSVLRRNTAQGARRSRRYENTLVLIREAEDNEHDEVSIEDLVPVVESPRTFGRFLCESAMIGLWNKFLECNDDSSESIDGSRHNFKTNGQGERSADPEKAFSGICRKLRNMLKQRHLPLGIIEALEENVLEFFLTNPLDSTYECGPLDAYRRGLLHAISQYNSLKSFSIGKNKTGKIVHVQNVQSVFSPPSLPLVSYIEKRLQNELKV